MQNDQREILMKICCDVFEHLAFMFGEDLDEDEIESEAEIFFRAQMSFTGKHNGMLEIIVAEDLSRSLAYNILGLDPSHRLEQGSAEDALKELLNTICGRFLPAVFGKEAIFNLSPPDITTIDHHTWQELARDHEFISVDIEDNPVLVKAIV